LGEEVDVILVVFELLFFLQFVFFLFVFDAEFFIVAVAPLVGIDVFVVLFDPGERFLLRHFYLFILATLHHY
jgi:hypothetical protein